MADFPISFYDELATGNRFANFAIEICMRSFGEEGFIPYPSKGKDGGVDAKQSRIRDGEIIFQYKFKEVLRYSPSKLQSSIKKDFADWAKQMSETQKGKKCIFITNVNLTLTTLNFFEEVVSANRGINLEFWHFERLNIEVQKISNHDLMQKYFPRRSREEFDKVSKELEDLKGKRSSIISKGKQSEAVENLRRLFVSTELKCRYYYAFIDLLEPFYLDKRGDEQRESLRNLFEITPEQELSFFEEMEKDRKVDLSSAICLPLDRELCSELQNEIFEKEVISLEIILALFN